MTLNWPLYDSCDEIRARQRELQEAAAQYQLAAQLRKQRGRMSVNQPLRTKLSGRLSRKAVRVLTGLIGSRS